MSKSFKIASPATFKSKVSIPRVGGEPLDVDFTFKVMGRKELAKLYSAWSTSRTSTLLRLSLSWSRRNDIAWTDGAQHCD